MALVTKRSFILYFFICNACFGQLQQADGLFDKAIGLARIGKYEKSIALLHDVQKQYLTHKNIEKYALSGYYLAVSQTEMNNDYSPTKKTLFDVLKVSRGKTSDTTLIRIYGELHRVYNLEGNKDSALVFSTKIENLFLKNADLKKQPCTVSYFKIKAYYANADGDFTKAKIYAENAINIEKNLPNDDKASMYNLLSLIYKTLKQYDKAFQYAKLAAELATGFSSKAYYYRELVLVFHEQGITTSGVNEFLILAKKNQQLSEKENKITDYDLEFYIATSEATQYRLTGNLNFASKKYIDAYEIAKNKIKTAKPAFLITTLIELSKIKYQQNLFNDALIYAQEALKAANKTFLSNDIADNPKPKGAYYQLYLIKALLNKAQLLHDIYMLTHKVSLLKYSVNTYISAFDAIDYLRKTYEDEEAKIFLNQEVYQAFSEAIKTIYDLRDYDKNTTAYLFDLQQRFQANLVLDELNNAQIKPKYIDKKTLEEERDLNRTITFLDVESAENLLKKDSINGLIKKKKLDLELIRNQIKNKSPNYYDAKYRNSLVKLSEFQNKIEINSLVISYTLLKDNVFITAISRNKTNTIKITLNSDFLLKLQYFRNLLANSPQGKKYNAQALSAELYDVLIKPIEKEIEGKKRLIIIRDAELNYLPFEVLAKQKDDFLLKKYIISYAYSASLLLPNKVEQKQGSGLAGFAPFSNNSFQQSLFRDKNLGQLPKSGNEVEKIGGDIYLENEATKKRFYEKYRNKNIIHFATHAITDDNDPLKSFIAFYPDGVDYKLFTNELYDLDLRNTSLVILSACETGAGKLQKGEGVMSLSRAFTYAGAKAVITTLWNAHDEASAYISEHFYKHLKDGLKTDEALQKAKLEFLNSDLALRYEHPYYWANFILIGPAETIDFGTNWWFWAFSMIFLLFLFFMVTKFRGKSISPKRAKTRIG